MAFGARHIHEVKLLVSENHIQPKGFDELVEEVIHEERDGFLSYYSGGSGASPVGFGVEIGEFDEACAYVDVNTLPLVPTEEQKSQYQALFNGLNAEETELLKSCGEPRVFFLWSTS